LPFIRSEYNEHKASAEGHLALGNIDQATGYADSAEALYRADSMLRQFKITSVQNSLDLGSENLHKNIAYANSDTFEKIGINFYEMGASIVGAVEGLIDLPSSIMSAIDTYNNYSEEFGYIFQDERTAQYIGDEAVASWTNLSDAQKTAIASDLATGPMTRLMGSTKFINRIGELELPYRLEFPKATFGALGHVKVVRNNKAVVTNKPLTRFDPANLPADEKAAKYRLTQMQSLESGAHQLNDHGPQTTLSQQKIRAETGLSPANNISYNKRGDPILKNSSRFNSYVDQEVAIKRAQVVYDQTGQTSVTIKMDRVIGEGYLKGGIDYRQTHTAVVNFNPSTGRPYTAFPEIR